MIRVLFCLCLGLIALLPLPQVARANEQVVLGLSQDRVAITARFDGSEILIFGAVKRETPIPDEPLDVIITIAGPSGPVTLRRKDQKFGIWINTASLKISQAPSFYAVATSRPLDVVLDQNEDLRHGISLDQRIYAYTLAAMTNEAKDFSAALVRIREQDGSYQMLEGAVDVDQQTLFRSSIALPSNLTEGAYETRIFLTRSGKVISSFDTVIDVRKVGLERFLFNLAQEQAALYGLLSLALAIFFGWAASAFFRLLRQG
ncbi:conserved hypothetical protein [Thalassovita litoralis]|jgi:uncharacterized protein (TIGR02186 family)|uniref:Transmembrane protein (Alph_Pro_TM) n=1 Tax=Thalassovita litoralis TaxID=1010611 RepID=A0A521FFB9_9RHOB|nr:TIGR02186 family protein [Thalassovita litoralis]SMO94839.1 conserved hypothetical protein [Thalassovita litoralis]